MSEADLARRPRALVAEDEEHLARLVADYLARDQITAQIAADGERALELARASAPDVVILDLMLPGIDGIEVCRRLAREAVAAALDEAGDYCLATA